MKHKSHKKERREKKKKHKERSSRESGDDVRVWLKLRFDGEYVLRRCLTGSLCSGSCLQAKTDTHSSSPLHHPTASSAVVTSAAAAAATVVSPALPVPEPNLQNNASTNRSSPVIQHQSIQPLTQNIIQSSSSSSSVATTSTSSSSSSTITHHHHLERHSPSMRASPASTATGGGNVITSVHHGQVQQELLLSAASSGSVLQSISPVPMSTIQSATSSPSPIIGGDNSNTSSGGGGGGLKFSYEKQLPTTNARIAALQEEESSSGGGRRSRTPDMAALASAGSGGGAYGMNSAVTSSIYGGAGGGGGGTSGGGGGGGGGSSVAGRGTKRNRKMSSNAGPSPIASVAGGSMVNVGAASIVPASVVAGGSVAGGDAKEGKLFQNGGSGAAGSSIVSATHMLGNQLNTSSSVAQKMSDQLSMEIEAHGYVPGPMEPGPPLMGPQFPGKNRANNPQPLPPSGGGASLSSMLTGGGTATANGNTPQSLEQLLERQWEQGSQFLMEQAQHFDIASLLSCLHQLRSENIRLEEHVNNLVARRDHLLAVNARLAIPLNPTATLGGVGIIGAAAVGGGGAGAGTGASGGGGSIGGGPPPQGQFNSVHGNGPIDVTVSNASSISGRSGRVQHGQNQQPPSGQQQGPPGHFGGPGVGSNPGGGAPMENGIDFRHTNSSHPATNSASIR
uniref:Alhambra n=1 Tax=Anopheles atroparvus TaxID=41427 RepID=A0A182IU62_ANOAO